ncbi:MAG: hypothetical protein HYZ94_02775 [Candidatus Omnitrophica bacterium]|nr:hypothetical protein [Candidatus Omnitrophota bacterium]
MKRFGIGICVAGGLACAVVLLEHQSKAAAANMLFGNMTYMTDSPYIVKKVTLVDGHCVTWNGRLHHSMHYEGRYVYGDFDRDGLKDAAVVVTQSEGGTGHFRELAFLINDGRHLVHRVSHSLGDRAIINSLKECGGKVVIDMFVHGEHDCMAGPTKRVKNVYDYLNPDPDVVPLGWTPPK